MTEQLALSVETTEGFVFKTVIVPGGQIPIGPVVVIGYSLHEVKHRTGHAADGPVPVVSYPHVQVTSVKILKILVKRNEVL